MALVDVPPGIIAADIGAGAGFYTRRLAEAVGPEGLVIATETNPMLVLLLASGNKLLGPDVVELNNVSPRWATRRNVGLGEESVDFAFLSHLDFYACPNLEPDEVAFLQSVHTAVKPKGKVAVLQWLYHHESRIETELVDLTPEEIRESTVANFIAAGFDVLSVSQLDLPEHMPRAEHEPCLTLEEAYTSVLIILQKNPGESTDGRVRTTAL